MERTPAWTQGDLLLLSNGGIVEPSVMGHSGGTSMSQVFTAVASTLLILFAHCVAANEGRAQQAYPTKPIQLVVTTAAGGTNDLVALEAGIS
jgi:hypothetical protein